MTVFTKANAITCFLLILTGCVGEGTIATGPGGQPLPAMHEQPDVGSMSQDMGTASRDMDTTTVGDMELGGDQGGDGADLGVGGAMDMGDPVEMHPNGCAWTNGELVLFGEVACDPSGTVQFVCDEESGRMLATGNDCDGNPTAPPEPPAPIDCQVQGGTIPADTEACAPDELIYACDGETGIAYATGNDCRMEPDRSGISPRPPYTIQSCPSVGGSYAQIPVSRQTDRHPESHPDMNMDWRGWKAHDAPLQFVMYNPDQWGIDPNAFKLHTLFEPARVPQFLQTYYAGHWDWGCATNGNDPQSGSNIGCRPGWVDGPLDSSGLGVSVTPGETLRLPFRQPEVAASGHRALVTYVGDDQIAFTYTSEDGPFGYTIHLVGICPDPALKQAVDPNFGRTTLPGVMNGQALGVARGQELLIFVRDQGSFMDVRAEPDWWSGHP